MVSPQPIDTLEADTASYPTAKHLHPLASPQLHSWPQPLSQPSAAAPAHPHSHALTPTQRVKRINFLPPTVVNAQPHLFDVYESNDPFAKVDLYGLDPYGGIIDGGMPDSYSIANPLSYKRSQSGSGELQCEQCWEQEARCAECTKAKQQQFLNGWPLDSPSAAFDFDGANAQHNFDSDAFVREWAANEQAWPGEQQHAMLDEEKSSETATENLQPPPPVLAPLSAPLFSLPAPGVGQGYENEARVQGKLTRFLPEGEYMDESYEMDSANSLPSLVHESRTGRALRQRKVRSRSPSPDLSERSATPGMDGDSAYDTDHYEPDFNKMSDSTSPPVVRYEDGLSSGSSAEPPQPTRLLPVNTRDLLPSRPSTAAVPPAHIKDRLVRSARKLLTAADGNNDNVQVQVIPIWYPNKQTPGAHKIRLIRVQNMDDATVSMYAHAADVGGVVERKSNISRLFGKFESPSEKLLMNVVGAHNHTVGQESNILTSKGVRKFLCTNKMKEEHAYRGWINSVLLPKLLLDPLEVGEEMLEIEASTDPRMPHHVKPKRMKRMEKKLAEKKRAAKERKPDEIASAAQPQQKRQKFSLTSPPFPAAFSGMDNFPAAPFHLNGPSTTGTPMSHAA